MSDTGAKAVPQARRTDRASFAGRGVNPRTGWKSVVGIVEDKGTFSVRLVEGGAQSRVRGPFKNRQWAEKVAEIEKARLLSASP